MRRLVSFFLAAVVAISLHIPAAASQGTTNVDITYREIKVVVNGVEITPCDGAGVPTEPFIMNSTGTTYLPVRAIANAMGLTPAWDGATNTITLTSGVEPYYGTGEPAASKLSTSEAITYRDIKIVLDGTELVTSAEPFIMNSTGTTYLPLRAVASALGLHVAWDGETSTVMLTSIPDGGVFSITPDIESVETSVGQSKVINFSVIATAVTLNCEYDEALVNVVWGEWQNNGGDNWTIPLTVIPLSAGDADLVISLIEVPETSVTVPVKINESQNGGYSLTANVGAIETGVGRNKVITFTVIGDGISLNCEYDDTAVDILWGEWQYVGENKFCISLTVTPLTIGTSNLVVSIPEIPDIYVTIPVTIKEVQYSELTAEEVYAQCSPAVFYLEVYDATGDCFASGSGFFIDSSGTAVTNYHVIEDAWSAKILTSDTGLVYDVLGVYDYDADEDWAVIKIDGTGFSYLTEGLSETIVGGSTVYAIGSPLGLDNTISQGLISNPCRRINNIDYIQTSAAISSGSSGGALINKYGEVIGITSAGYTSGQNLNLALPISIIHNYSAAKITSLPELFPQASSTKQQAETFAKLKSIILSRSNFTVSGNSAYKYQPAGSAFTYVLVYSNEGTENITLMCQFNSSVVCYSSMTIGASGTMVSPTFSIYNDIYSSDPFVRGSSRFYSSALSSNYYLDFTSYEGDTSWKETAQELFKGNLILAVTFADNLLSPYGYSMDAFGFTCV